MPNEILKYVMRRMNKPERDELTLAYQHPHITYNREEFLKTNPVLTINLNEFPSRLELVCRIQRLLHERELANELSALEGGSLLLVLMGLASTGEIPETVREVIPNKPMLCIYAARGAFKDNRISPEIKTADWEELYGLTMRYEDKGKRCLKECQPEIRWRVNGVTESIPVTPDNNAKTVFYNFLKDLSRNPQTTTIQ